MSNEWIEMITSTPEGASEYQFEGLKIEFLERIEELMKKQGVSREELAKRMNCSLLYLTKFFHGDIDLCLQELSDIFLVLDHEIVIGYKSLNG